MNKVLEKIKATKVVPVVVLQDSTDAIPLAKALVDGGLPCAEVTFRTEAAEESIQLMKSEYPQMLVGAGTVITMDQLERALRAGAEFIVSPGFDPEIVDECIKRNVPVLPGCVTPSEVIQAVKRNLEVIKFFPAEQYGGVATIKALGAAFPSLKFMPTGGIGTANLEEYLGCDKIWACGGSWMVKGDMIAAGEFDKIRDLTRAAVELAETIRK
ncbi:MAG: bifunctional 4-hydroxy-2-oxoglutarate aldolase/2-dehydro-3-deoxy-phosphogluconate aldolase [Clostridia bacterium]|nr:bifunctional 4-hydroxy-2-oxoglutarate aldolase/2-dehydro-3-deoxy-phosphogluconate aldolase [Clostridia bacterium]NCC44727.1 bifunctional 4-hydroxy-2-oxoglutarate aldolase/2-dehydro-3-deoxy-phosphogluconate aldolase [Clostridia bacterium]